MQFDIKDLYPFFTEALLLEAMQFTKDHVLIKRKDVEVIFHVGKSVLYNDRVSLEKKEDNNLDDTMAAYDGAEVYELIDIYMLYLIEKKYWATSRIQKSKKTSFRKNKKTVTIFV